MKRSSNKFVRRLAVVSVSILVSATIITIVRVRQIAAAPVFIELSDPLLKACQNFRNAVDRQEAYDAANAIISLETDFHGVGTRNTSTARGKSFHSLASYVEALGGPDWIILDEESWLESIMFPRGRRYCWRIRGKPVHEFDNADSYLMLISEDGVSVRHASF